MTVTTETDSPSSAGTPATPTRIITGWVAGALVLGLILGLGVAFLIPRNPHPGDDSVEAGFLRDMSTHHAQAVEMSMIAHAGSANAEIISLSSDIALTQHGQIGIMLAWLRDWDLNPTSTRPVMAWMPDSEGSVQNGLMPGMATPQQLDSLRKATGKEQDIQFLTLMRQHHLGGIHMAQEIITLSDNADVTWLADTMVTAQQGEVALIQSLLAKYQTP